METQTNRIKLILADDDRDDCQIFAKALNSLGLSTELTVVENGQKLVDLLSDPNVTLPHMVFLDINMPMLSGLEALLLIRKMEKCRKLPIVIFSTSSSRKDLEESQVRGANIYIHKPNSFAQLKELIKKAVQIDWHQANSKFVPKEFVMRL